MSAARELDDYLERQSHSSYKSSKKLAKIVREAYPIGVPAMIMKSSTDRLGKSAGYSFHLGTPDDLLRRIASWILTNSKGRKRVLLGLITILWKRHGREDVALAALLLANLDYSRIGVTPWSILASSINNSEPVEALLLNIEELFRAKQSAPSDEILISWCNGRLVESHLALITAYSSKNSGGDLGEKVIDALKMVKVPDGDSLLRRIKDRVVQS
ncbi:MAG: hypothetical protein CMA12_04825 [Euryarchaeota archaeon]|nr:hypothetical protein [Euryarchaeota archaeon]|tara:strand:- start:173 stop:817 length:645 start_codon:yes stop_codon:yes gene_type:complete